MGRSTTNAAGVVFFLLAAVASQAAAQVASPPRGQTGFEVGIRAGYGLPRGSRIGGEAFDRSVNQSLPLIVDAGYRLTPNLYLGALVSYAWLGLDKAGLGCNTQAVDGPGDCSGSSVRVAADIQWRAPIRERYAAWVDAGVGVERLAIDFDSGGFGGPFSRTDYGLELGHLEIGAGARLQSRLVVGPFASFSLGQFLTSTTSGNPGTADDAIPDKALHGWLILGLRAMFTRM